MQTGPLSCALPNLQLKPCTKGISHFAAEHQSRVQVLWVRPSPVLASSSSLSFADISVALGSLPLFLSSVKFQVIDLIDTFLYRLICLLHLTLPCTAPYLPSYLCQKQWIIFAFILSLNTIFNQSLNSVNLPPNYILNLPSPPHYLSHLVQI